MQLQQQRDFGEKINATFTYAGENVRSLGLALLYIAGPVTLLAGISTGMYQSNILKIATQSINPADPFAIFNNMFSVSFLLTIVFGMLASLAVSLTTYSHMKLYARSESGNAITVADVWAEVQPMIGRALIITLLSSLVTLVATCFLFLPGVYIGVILSLALAVTSFEGTDFGATWSRCFYLINDKWWSTLGLLIVTGVILAIISIAFGIPAAIIGAIIGRGATDSVSLFIVLGQAFSTVGTTLLYSLLYLAIGFQYFNLVERRDKTGMLSAIDSIGQSPAKPRGSEEGEF